MTSEIKACRDCKHYHDTDGFVIPRDMCTFFSKKVESINYITGKISLVDNNCKFRAHDMRANRDSYSCGPEAMFFEQKEIEPSLLDKLRKFFYNR